MRGLVLPSLVVVVLGGEECAQVEPKVVLSNGMSMPRVGLGTAGRMRSPVVTMALEEGVALIDTARAKEWYDEDAAAAAVGQWKNRSSVIVVTKMHPRDHGTASCRAAIEDSAAKFGGYVDVFLQHYPRCWEALCGPGLQGDWRDSWRAMEAAYARGEVRAIGASNLDVGDTRELIAFAKIGPHVIQNWMDPFHQDREVRELCRDRGIAYMSYSTLGTQWEMRGRGNPVATHGVLRAIADARHTTPFAVALAWAVARGAIVVPRSTNPTHVAANARVFDGDRLALCLGHDDLASIDALDDSDLSATATFAADAPARLFWLDDLGNERHVADLEPSAPSSIQTTLGHVFRARTLADATLLGTFTVTARSHRFDVPVPAEEEL